MTLGNYRMGDTVKDELTNNLILVDAIIGKKNLKSRPVFYLLGGAALVFHNLNYKATLDIDTANAIEASIKADIDLFIDDAASEVVSIHENYKSRAIRYLAEELTSIEVYLLSYEDLLLTKLQSGRRKDIQAVKTCGILKKVNKVALFSILQEECTDVNLINAVTILYKEYERGLYEGTFGVVSRKTAEFQV